jgi:2',3'-cyclic-nucleotide 2'-phosphodiesterase
MKKRFRALFIADIVADPGMEAVEQMLPDLIHEHDIDLVIANGENAWDGKSIHPDQLERLKKVGVQVITGGNHTWERYQIHGLLKSEPGMIRPLNYPQGVSGRGWCQTRLPGLPPIVVINIQGRVFMPSIDCPFRAMDRALDRIDREIATKGPKPIILVDVHAEASAEKIALAHYLDGQVSALFGTHTHVQTADERILEGGLGYITDAGMTGCHESVIGLKTEVAIRRFLTHTPHKYEPAKGLARLQGVLVEIDPATLLCRSISRLTLPDYTRD